ncbi:Uncharacterized protein TCAP_02990 [Tolypocladium capitatum]|uniref:Alginate lyase 2 domain-containing protein n=1 Tax=Tolypocladium capitatum TaxID=45235 RepID=A0A2K3QHR5_9HYPO|nr:Uncharacterized protein TCAP_02990 [Tolypocladium capitatum]
MHLSTLFPSSSAGGLATLSVLLLQSLPISAALNPKCHPGGNFDLSKWNLQLPIGKGRPQEIPSRELQGCNGYTNKDYFYTSDSDGTLVMKVPGSPSTSKCVTTPDSIHCRTELRENSPSSWSPFAPVNRLFGDLVVTKNDGGICIGQIHIDDSISHKPVAELYHNSNGDLKMGVQKCRTCTQQLFDVDHVPKGQRFTYEIRYEGNKLSVSINGKAAKQLTTFDLDGPNSYFKAGNYNQGNDPTETRFYAIRVTHS